MKSLVLGALFISSVGFSADYNCTATRGVRGGGESEGQSSKVVKVTTNNEMVNVGNVLVKIESNMQDHMTLNSSAVRLTILDIESLSDENKLQSYAIFQSTQNTIVAGVQIDGRFGTEEFTEVVCEKI